MPDFDKIENSPLFKKIFFVVFASTPKNAQLYYIDPGKPNLLLNYLYYIE